VFDFDGTLVDSNAIKLGAFEPCFAEFLPTHPEILDYCHSNHHTPRSVKFRHVYQEILKRPYTAEIEKKLLKRYAELTTQAVSEAPEIPGAVEFVRSVPRASRTALISSTPHEVLLRILAGRGWESLFHFVQGAPMKKSSWVRGLVQTMGLTPDDALFLGDT